MGDIFLFMETMGALIVRVASTPFRLARRVGWRLRVLRRRWCLRRGHPMASWSPVCVSYKATATRLEDGRIIEGAEITQRAYRCARHDRPPPPLKRYDITIDLC